MHRACRCQENRSLRVGDHLGKCTSETGQNEFLRKFYWIGSDTLVQNCTRARQEGHSDIVGFCCSDESTFNATRFIYEIRRHITCSTYRLAFCIDNDNEDFHLLLAWGREHPPHASSSSHCLSRISSNSPCRYFKVDLTFPTRSLNPRHPVVHPPRLGLPLFPA